MAKKNFRPMAVIMGVLFTAFGLWYTFWGLDLIADTAALGLGFLDDAVVIAALWIIFKRWQKKLNKMG